MSTIATRSEILERLARAAAGQGLEVTKRTDVELAAKREAITAKWLLGSRWLVYRLSLRLDEGAQVVRFREATMETSRGLPPPTFTIETETISGRTRSGTRRDVAPGGGGAIDYAAARGALEQVAREGGWGFVVEIGFPA